MIRTGYGARFWWVWLARVIAVSWGSRAHAAEHAIDVQAPPDYADRAQLIDAIRSRLPEFTPVGWADPTPASEASVNERPAKRPPPETTLEPKHERVSRLRSTGSREWYGGVGAFGGWLATGLPQSPLGFGLFAELLWARNSWFAPSLRLAAVDAGTSTGHTARGDVDVSLIVGRLSLCPLRTPHELANLRVCALGELGRLSGEGRNTVDQSTDTATWSAAGIAVGFELVVLPPLVFELEGASLFPFNRDRFVFEPEPVHVGYEVPAVSASVSVGASFRF